MLDFKGIDKKAENLLKLSNALAQPVNLRKVLEHLKITAHKKELEDEYSGFLAIKEKTIVVNLRHARVRRRFTIAHEIGHYQLHQRERDNIPAFIDRTVYFRKGNFNNTSHLMEMEANAYAAGLLMPEILLDQYLEKHPQLDLEKTADIKMLAEEFEVSRPAMDYRLRNLGFVLPTSF